MTLAKSKPEDISLKTVMQEPREIKMNGFFKLANDVYDDLSAVGYTIEEAKEAYARVLKITLAKLAPVWRREASRKEYQERRKQYAR